MTQQYEQVVSTTAGLNELETGPGVLYYHMNLQL